MASTGRKVELCEVVLMVKAVIVLPEITALRVYWVALTLLDCTVQEMMEPHTPVYRTMLISVAEEHEKGWYKDIPQLM